MGKVLIATAYNADAVLVAAHRLGPDRLFLLVNEEETKDQAAALDIIKNSLGRVIEVKTFKVPAYDIVLVAKKAIDLIDAQPNTDTLYVNITSGRKTLAIGLLLAAYRRPSRVKKIAYNPEEDKSAVVYLPKLSFDLNNSQEKVLAHLAKAGGKSITTLADEIEISRAMLYRTVQELKEKGLVDDEEGIVLTDAGKIARM